TKARELYAAVLERDPNFSPARQGMAEARRQINLAVTYDLALEVANAGNLPRALNMLLGIQRLSPAFRDVDAQINRLHAMNQVADLYEQAEKAFAQHRWLEAVRLYEQVAAQAVDYQPEALGMHLSEAYF